MKIDILTLFPDIFTPLFESILGRAIKEGIIEINTINLRDFSKNKHKKCDDIPFGGGAGMVMTPQPIFDAIKSILTDESNLIFLTPKGEIFKHSTAVELAKEKHLIFLCGHYEGIDERIIEIFNPKMLSIGDFVLTGGELPAMVVIDAVARYIDGVINSESLTEESHADGFLEYPHYTRPRVFQGIEVPEILISGNHEKIKQWRKEKSIEETKKYRKDLLKI